MILSINTTCPVGAAGRTRYPSATGPSSGCVIGRDRPRLIATGPARCQVTGETHDARDRKPESRTVRPSRPRHAHGVVPADRRVGREHLRVPGLFEAARYGDPPLPGMCDAAHRGREGLARRGLRRRRRFRRLRSRRGTCRAHDHAQCAAGPGRRPASPAGRHAEPGADRGRASAARGRPGHPQQRPVGPAPDDPHQPARRHRRRRVSPRRSRPRSLRAPRSRPSSVPWPRPRRSASGSRRPSADGIRPSPCRRTSSRSTPRSPRRPMRDSRRRCRAAARTWRLPRRCCGVVRGLDAIDAASRTPGRLRRPHAATPDRAVTLARRAATAPPTRSARSRSAPHTPRRRSASPSACRGRPVSPPNTPRPWSGACRAPAPRPSGGGRCAGRRRSGSRSSSRPGSRRRSPGSSSGR